MCDIFPWYWWRFRERVCLIVRLLTHATLADSNESSKTRCLFPLTLYLQISSTHSRTFQWEPSVLPPSYVLPIYLQVQWYYSPARIAAINKLFVAKQVIFQYNYKRNIPRWRLNLLHRKARNHFLLTNSVLLSSKRRFQGSKFRSFQLMRLLHVLTKKNVHILVRFFRESERFRVTQRCHEQDNDCVHNSQFCSGRVKVTARKFPDTTVNKRTCFLSSKIYTTLGYIVSQIRLNSRAFCSVKMIEIPAFWLSFNFMFPLNEPKVVWFIARRPVCFVRLKRRKVERPTVRCHKLEKYNPYHYDGRIVRFRNTFS